MHVEESARHMAYNRVYPYNKYNYTQSGASCVFLIVINAHHDIVSES